MNHKKTQHINQKTLTIVIIGAFASLLVVGLLFTTVLQSKDEFTVNKTKTIELMGLHPTYTSIKQMLSEPDLVFAGRAVVLDNGTVSSEIVENAPPEAPPLVKTDYKLQVKSVIRGKDIPAEIILSVNGGVVKDTRYVLEDVPVLKKGDTIILFAGKSDDGKYYALAGDTAIALQKDNSRFILGKSTINTGAVTFTEQDITP